MQARRPLAGPRHRPGRVAARSAVAPAAQASGPPPELRAVIDAMPEAVLVSDPRDQVRIVNPAADRLFAGQPVQDAGAERRAFLSILSHELRTPITTIYAGSRVLARRDAANASGSQEIARDISAEAARLYDVVEDLLVLTRAEQHLLELSDEPILLQRVVEGAIRVARGRSPDVPIVTDGATEPPAVAGDAVYVEQVVRNLVTAASRFAQVGAPVVIRLAEGEDEVLLTVLDRGPNLSPEELETSFALTDVSAARASGVGIGLFVCRRLVEAMNGRVWVSPRDGGGAEFGFALPRYEPE